MAIFVASQVFAPYQPALTVAPETWALALKYVGNGHEFDGPGAMAFDEHGDVWVTNNYIFRSNHSVPTCGSDMLLKLTATGADAPGAPYRGKQGDLDGAGFGITLDPNGNVWVGNFGFFGSTCPPNLIPPANSVSKFNPDGMVLSPRTGFTQGCISSPQGTVSDQQDNIWIANACGSTITRYHAGNPNDSWVFDIGTGQLADPGSSPSFSGAKPFDIAINADGNAWVSNNTDNTVFKLSPNGTLIVTANSPETGIKAPLGVAVDGLGTVWISNSGIIEIPCATLSEAQDYGDLAPDLDQASVTELNSDGNPVGTQPYKGGGIVIPWGIAVDGNDNIWVATFGGERVTELCDAKPENCPPGYQTGQPIAPNGYYSDALVRNTGGVHRSIGQCLGN